MKSLSVQIKFYTLCFLIYLTSAFSQKQVDVLIVGGGTGGTSAAIQAARSGAKVVVLEKTTWLGGMLTSAGVSAIDGNHHLPSGIWGEFRDRLYAHYGGPENLATGWVSHTLFEPSVGNSILRQMTKHKNITIIYDVELKYIKQENKMWHIEYLSKQHEQNISAKILIDATERGSLLPIINVPFRLGMDSRHETNEKQAPDKANTIVQDMTYVAILEKIENPKNDNGLVKKPKNYNKDNYACACKREGDNMLSSVTDCEQMLNYGRLPNDKYMINWPNCGNDYFMDWPSMSKDQQKSALYNAKKFTQGFVYYIQQELGYNNLRLANEFPTADGYPIIPYERESRRIKGEVFLSVNHLENPYGFNLYRTGIAVGDYPIDHHHDKNQNTPKIDFISIKIPSYNIPLGALINNNFPNFIVAEKNISVSNIVNGTTRLQPVVMGIGQAAGALAATSILMNLDVNKVPIRKVQNELLRHDAYLMPFIDVYKKDPAFKAIQRIGASGVLQGFGVPNKWSNQTWFYPERHVSQYELLSGLLPLYPSLSKLPASENFLTISSLAKLIGHIDSKYSTSKLMNIVNKTPFLNIIKPDQVLNRKEISVIIDELINPFELKINYKGDYLKEK